MKMKETNPNADYSLALADIYHNLKPTQKTQVKQLLTRKEAPMAIKDVA